MLKTIIYKKKNSAKYLEILLNKRKSYQKSQKLAVSKILENVKRNGDKAVLNYEKKFSKVKQGSKKIFFSKNEISNISKN